MRYHRKMAGLSQLALAQLTGVGKTVIFDIEHNKPTIKLNTLIKILHALNISIQLESPLMFVYQSSLSHEKS